MYNGTRAPTMLLLRTEAASVLPFFCAPPVRPPNIPSVDWTRSQGDDYGALTFQRSRATLTYQIKMRLGNQHIRRIHYE
jgi:hypothetical protein